MYIDAFKIAANREKRLSGVDGRIARDIYGKTVAGYYLDMVDNGVEYAKEHNLGCIENLADVILDEMYNSVFESFSKHIRFMGKQKLLKIIDDALLIDRKYCKEFSDYCVKVWGMEDIYVRDE